MKEVQQKKGKKTKSVNKQTEIFRYNVGLTSLIESIRILTSNSNGDIIKRDFIIVTFLNTREFRK